MANIVYPQGKNRIAVASGNKIAVYSPGAFTVWQESGYPNQPNSLTQLTNSTGGDYTSAAFSSAGYAIIEAGASEVYYEQGTDAVYKKRYRANQQPTPGVLNATGALTAAMMLSGIVTSTTGAAVAATVPTGPVLDLASEFATDEGVYWNVINTGGNTFTVTAASGHTIVGVAAVATVTSAAFVTRKTAANTFVTYRLS